MLYFILRPFARLGFRIYFRKIYLHMRGSIPSKGPVMLAVNHPSSFMEACVLACFLPRSLYFLVRGDVFVNPLVNFLLNSTHQIPIYRFRDGFSSLRNNHATFAQVYRWLGEGKVVTVFAEGTTRLEKKLRPIQKGLARMVFGAMEMEQLTDIPIVPIGVNYTEVGRWRSEVMIEVGQPLSARSFLEEEDPENKRGVRHLTAAIEASMRPLVTHVNHDQDEHLFNQLCQLDRPGHFWHSLPNVSHRPDTYDRERYWASRVNEMEADRKASLTGLLKNLDHHGPELKRSWWYWLSWPGSLIHRLPLSIGYRITGTWAKPGPFYAPVLWGSGTFISLIFWILLLIPSFILFGWWSIAGLVALAILGYLHVLAIDHDRVAWEKARIAAFEEQAQGVLNLPESVNLTKT